MDQFARFIAVQTLAGNDRAKAERLSKALDVTPFYFEDSDAHLFPPPAKVLQRYNKLLSLINAAADPQSEAWQKLEKIITYP